MAKRVQKARLVVAKGVDFNNHVTDISIPLNHEGLTEITLKIVGVQIDVDPDTREIRILVGETPPEAVTHD